GCNISWLLPPALPFRKHTLIFSIIGPIAVSHEEGAIVHIHPGNEVEKYRKGKGLIGEYVCETHGEVRRKITHDLQSCVAVYIRCGDSSDAFRVERDYLPKRISVCRIHASPLAHVPAIEVLSHANYPQRFL